MDNTNNETTNNKIKRKRDPAKSKLIRTIFEIDDKLVEQKPKSNKVIIIRYDETIYFKKDDNNKDDIQNYISILQPNSTSNNNNNLQQSTNKSPQNIQLNFNINNNYYQDQPSLRYRISNSALVL